MRKKLVAALGLLICATPASAFIPASYPVTCPVGGEQFAAEGFASYSSYGSRPDGKVYTNWVSPQPLAVCPSNGLVVYRTFTEAEVARLEQLIATDAYRAMRQTETTYFRAAWLERQLDPASGSLLPLLLQATWQAGDGSERHRRYLREYAVQAEAAPAPADDLLALSWRARAVNARRELGEFDAAQALLDTFATANLDVTVPEEQRTTLENGAIQISNAAEIEAAQQKRGLLSYLEMLRRLIARQDASSEPLDAIPPRQAAGRCMEITDMASAPQLTQEACAAPQVQRWINIFTASRDAFRNRPQQ